MKTYKSQWMKLPKSIKKEYEKGATILDLALKYKVSAVAMRVALAERGTKMRPPGGRVPGREHSARKLSDDDILLILKLDKENVGHSEIARRINNTVRTISRERIRQICAQAGHEPRWGRMPNEYEKKRAGILVRKQAREERIRRASRAWKDGKSMEEIGYILYENGKTINYINNRIQDLRKQYGLGLFPYRRPNHWSLRTMEQRIDHIKKMSKVWNKYASIKQIKKRFGYKTLATANASIYLLRKKYPYLFPKKIEILEKRMRNQ